MRVDTRKWVAVFVSREEGLGTPRRTGQNPNTAGEILLVL